jgi:RHS repeat-associated protein
VVTPQVNTAEGFAYTPAQRLEDGPHSVTARAYDQAGNQTQTAPWGFSVDTGVAPSLGVTKYYYFGAQRVAMWQEDQVYYLHGDHLGSTSLTTDENGAVFAETRYLPYGEQRWPAVDAQPTDFTFTGQRVERGFGLMDYRARFYDPRLGRFVSADTVVPEPGAPIDLNRFAYARNNPLKYNDPTGHNPPAPDYPILEQAIKYFESMGWKVVGDPTTKSLMVNGADVVFANKPGNVLAVELKALSTGNVDLGTLGVSDKFGDYGGSIDRVARSAQRFLTSSNSQLSLESQTIKNAYDAGKLQNALFTSAEGVSEGAQEQFNAVYRTTSQGAIEAVKPLPRPSVWSSVKDQINTRVFNYTIGAKMLWEKAASTATMLGNPPILPPIPIIPNPSFYQWHSLCPPNQCEPVQG